MDPSVVVWIGILLALLQVAVTKILNYYFPDGYHRPGAVKNEHPVKETKESDQEDSEEKS